MIQLNEAGKSNKLFQNIRVVIKLSIHHLNILKFCFAIDGYNILHQINQLSSRSVY